MANIAETHEATERAVKNAVRVFRATLAEAIGQGYYGYVNVQFHFQNGKLETIKSTHERHYKCRD
jgi:uncharacterized protein with FMN-binding domain